MIYYLVSGLILKSKSLYSCLLNLPFHINKSADVYLELGIYYSDLGSLSLEFLQSTLASIIFHLTSQSAILPL